MTVKEIISTTSLKDILDEIYAIEISTYLDDTLMIIEIYNKIKNSTSKKKAYPIAFIDSPGNFPSAVKVHPDGRHQILIESPAKVINCDICDKTGKLSDIRMLTFLILHFTAFTRGEIPHEFLADRYRLTFI